MAFTGLATKVYKDPLTVQWMNSVKQNDDFFLTAAAKAWVTLDGSGVASAHVSLNVDSITRNAGGNFTVIFTTGFTTSNYVTLAMTRVNSGLLGLAGVIDNTADSADTGSIRISTRHDNGSPEDPKTLNVVVFGDKK